MKNILLLIILTLTYATILPQTKPNTKKNKEKFTQAIKYYQNNNNPKALKICDKTIKKDPNYTAPYVLKAQIKAQENQYDQAIKLLQKVIQIDPNYNEIYYFIGIYSKKNKQFTQAKKYFQQFIATKNKNKQRIINAQREIQQCTFIIQELKNPKKFTPQKLPETINTNYDEYFPTITADTKTLIFTRQTNNNENIYISNYTNNSWQTAYNINNAINTTDNEGAHCISADGKTLIYTRCGKNNSGCDLYITTKKQNNKWKQPQKISNNINSKYWETQPTISPNGKTIYFVSNRPGGYGKADIYYTNKINGKWTKPKNIGNSINSQGNEMSPFIHFDNKTLYFVSDYHIGMGKFDIFMSRKINDTTWTKPKNIGYPINSFDNEYRLIVDPNAKTAYFSSAKNKKTKQDIYSFNIENENIKPQKTIYITGNIYTKQQNKTTKTTADKITIINTNNKDTILTQTNTNNFAVCLPQNNSYAINIIKKEYMLFSKNINLENTTNTTNTTQNNINITLTPITQNSKIILKNLFFNTNSYTINPKSFVELNKLTEFLNINKNIKIQINGHTDSTGNYNYNIKLSENRAKEVKKYLTEKGINPQRIQFKGLGDTMPIAENQTLSGRKLNRRTEIVILKK